MSNWINPETKKPEQKQPVLFKTVVFHTKKIRYGRFIDEDFQEFEAGGSTHNIDDVWGWMPFEDLDKRD